MRRVLRDNGLSITMFALFLIFLVAQSIAGHKASNSENEQHRQSPESYGEYLTSGAFVEATFENWESEFLQMGAYVALTALLIQKGSPESKKPDGDDVDADPRDRQDAGVLVPVHAELAERVPGRGRPHRPEHLPAPARLPRVQARGRPPRPDRQQLTPVSETYLQPRRDQRLTTGVLAVAPDVLFVARLRRA